MKKKLVFACIIFILINGLIWVSRVNADSGSSKEGETEETKLSVSEQLMYTTVRIACIKQGKKGSGTGFFFRFRFFNDSRDYYIPSIVTNTHVVEGAEKGIFFITEEAEDGSPMVSKSIPIIFYNFEKAWRKHESVDLCVMPIAPLLKQAKEKGKKPFIRYFDKEVIPSDEELAELTAIEDVIMVGYPIGLMDEVHNLPIMRSGITATHPNVDYNGKEEFLIDAACFPGSSGSPVCLFDKGTYWSKKDGHFKVGVRFKLLGILYGGPQYTEEGKIVVKNIPTKVEPYAMTKIPINIGYVIKSKKLFDFKNSFKKELKLKSNIPR